MILVLIEQKVYEIRGKMQLVPLYVEGSGFMDIEVRASAPPPLPSPRQSIKDEVLVFGPGKHRSSIIDQRSIVSILVYIHY